jgi:hypothetical protein
MKIGKYFLFFIGLLFVTKNGFCQQNQDTIGNFISKSGSVYWTHRFEKKLSFLDLLYSVKRSNNLIGIDTFKNTILGQSIESFMDYRGAGYTAMTTPIFLSNSSYKSSVLIENYDSFYVVTIKKIIFINQNDTKQVSQLLGSSQGETSPLEGYAIKKTGKFRTNFSKSSAEIIDYNFIKLYDF